jgi:arylsulfatase A-like enzyme
LRFHLPHSFRYTVKNWTDCVIPRTSALSPNRREPSAISRTATGLRSQQPGSQRALKPALASGTLETSASQGWFAVPCRRQDARFLIQLTLLYLLCTFGFFRAAGSSPTDRDKPKPNIIVILADQWRAQAFGYVGNPNVKTPYLDQLACQSIQLVNAVAGVPVCSPTRASLLTGQRPLTHGVFLNDVPLDPKAVTLPKVLQAAGYDTAAIGKWHIDGHGRSNFIPRERRQGFDYWKVLECTHDYTNSFYFADAPEKLRWGGYDALAQTRDACSYFKSRTNSARPFLLWLAWGPPHDPYHTAPEKFRALYDADKLVLRANVPAVTAARARKDLAGYYAHCSALDSALGELLDVLHESRLWSNTILVFSSDHGDMLGSQGLSKKQKPFDESIRVPMIISWPAKFGVRSQKLSAPMNSEDLMPTLLGLAGVPIPKTVQGLDYSRYLSGGKNPGDNAAMISSIAPFADFGKINGGREFRGLRTIQYTYVRDLAGPWLLFDNHADPFQTNNLVNNSAFKALRAKLDAHLQHRLRENKDDFRPASDYLAKWGYQVDRTGAVPYKR